MNAPSLHTKSLIVPQHSTEQHTYPGHMRQAHSVAVAANQLVHHGLKRPLRQERRHRVVPPVQQQQHCRTNVSRAPIVKQLPLLHCGQVVQRLGQLLTGLAAGLVADLEASTKGQDHRGEAFSKARNCVGAVWRRGWWEC